jgi:hypothetical protein
MSDSLTAYNLFQTLVDCQYHSRTQPVITALKSISRYSISHCLNDLVRNSILASAARLNIRVLFRSWPTRMARRQQRGNTQLVYGRTQRLGQGFNLPRRDSNSTHETRQYRLCGINGNNKMCRASIGRTMYGAYIDSITFCCPSRKTGLARDSNSFTIVWQQTNTTLSIESPIDIPLWTDASFYTEDLFSATV